MLMPKKVKYRKQQRGRMAGKAWRGSDVSFGDYGLKALEPCWLTARQIEAARVAMTRFIKRGGKIWVRVFPDKPITKKPQETRMGKGKGAPEQWVCVVRPGRILFEMEGVNEIDAREAMRLAAAKLPIKTKFATRFARGESVMKVAEITRPQRRRAAAAGEGTRRPAVPPADSEVDGAARGGTQAEGRCAAIWRGSRPCCARRRVGEMAIKEITGVVVSDKMDKSVVVSVERQVRHALYGKTQRRTSKFLAHDEGNEAKVGDRVAIVETRPLSRRKRWVVTRVVEKAEGGAQP